MSDQLPMFGQTTCEDTLNAIGSPALESGRTLCDSPDGTIAAKSGPDPAPASLSAPQAKAKRSTTKGIFGQPGFLSSQHDDLSFALASRYRALTDSLGSTLFDLTWMTRNTPTGFSIPAQRASEPRTEDSVCIGWPTPRAEDAESCGMRHGRTAVASLASWASPKARDHKHEPKTACSAERMAEHAPDLSKQAILSGWPTPMAGTPVQNGNNEVGNSDSSRKTVEMCQCPVDPSTDSGAGPIGFLLGLNGWEIVPACGQLNAGHSRWLMGLPASWDQCAIAAFRSLKKRKRGSGACVATATE